MFQTKVVEKILCSITFFFFSKIVPVIEGNLEKYYRAGQTADDSMANAHCLLVT
jgi:hypothetical protein